MDEASFTIPCDKKRYSKDIVCLFILDVSDFKTTAGLLKLYVNV